MKRNLLVLFFAISMMVSIYLAFRTQPAQAQKTSTTNDLAKQKWDYCAIIGSSNMNEGGNAVGTSTIVYFDTSSYQEEKVKIQGEKVGEPIRNEYQRVQQRAFETAIAQLGNQGWEMIGQLPYNGYFRSGVEEPTAIYFKRIKR